MRVFHHYLPLTMHPTLLLPPLLLLYLAAHGEELTRIEIKGGAAQELRRVDTAGRIIVSREELHRYGDANLADALRRQPGIAIVDGMVQMRGLGGGRTQVLINGEAAPPGFSPDSLAPALIERIEILRSASADSSTQGIAGAINIVLRKSAPAAHPKATLTAAHTQAGSFPESAFELPLKGQAYSGLLAAHAARSLDPFDSKVFSSSTSPGKANQRVTQESGRTVMERAGLAPRMNWKFDDASTLLWQGLFDVNRIDNHGQAQETIVRGAASDYPRNHFDSRARTLTARSDASGAMRLGDRGRFEWKAGLNFNRRDSDYLFTGSDLHNAPIWLRQVVSDAADYGASSSGKWKFGAAADAGHALVLGWDGTLARRSEGRRQQDADAGGAPLGLLDQRYIARVQRLAFYAQDEWSPTPKLDLYIGLRWEALHTRTEGRDLPQVAHHSSVWSPVAHVLYRLPGGHRQWRVGLSRTYKAPATRDLVPRRFTVNNDNAPTNPHFQGNPSLRPELAWGIDLAYEAYFGQAGMFSASAYGRRVDDVILPFLFQDHGAWTSTPRNAGRADVRGLEFDGRVALGASGATVRAALSRNWSTVAAVPGPDNRLGEQIPLTFNFGLDYRVHAGATVGLNWNVQAGAWAHTSSTQWRDRGPVRRLDVYGRWQANSRLAVRLTAANLLAPVASSAQLFVDAGNDVLRKTVTNGGRTLKFSIELPI